VSSPAGPPAAAAQPNTQTGPRVPYQRILGEAERFSWAGPIIVAVIPVLAGVLVVGSMYAYGGADPFFIVAHMNLGHVLLASTLLAVSGALASTIMLVLSWRAGVLASPTRRPADATSGTSRFKGLRPRTVVREIGLALVPLGFAALLFWSLQRLYGLVSLAMVLFVALCYFLGRHVGRWAWFLVWWFGGIGLLMGFGLVSEEAKAVLPAECWTLQDKTHHTVRLIGESSGYLAGLEEVTAKGEEVMLRARLDRIDSITNRSPHAC
jgi:hypothetical protein